MRPDGTRRAHRWLHAVQCEGAQPTWGVQWRRRVRFSIRCSLHDVAQNLCRPHDYPDLDTSHKRQTFIMSQPHDQLCSVETGDHHYCLRKNRSTFLPC